jgi:hypothetical protein
MIAQLDRMLALIGAMQWLGLPLVFLLFLQWPLRELARCCSREANDFGQRVFALFIAVSITAATRADTLAQRYGRRTRHLLRKAGAIVGLSADREQAGRPVFCGAVRGVSRYGQSRLLRDQARGLDHDTNAARAGARRDRPTDAAESRLMEWADVILLLLVASAS